MYLTLGLVTALAVILARTQSRLIDSIQKVVHVNRHGVAAVSIIANPDVYHHSAVYGPERDFSPHLRRRVAVNAGLLQLILMAIVRDPQKASLPLDGAVALPD